MRKIILTVLTSVFITAVGFSQDTITVKSGEDIQAKVLEVTKTEIKYKKYDNQNGPTFTMDKSEVSMIRYENGTKDLFREEKKTEEITAQSGKDLYMQGRADASRYYRKYKGAGTGTLITGLVSPLAGLVPAIICSTSEPKDKNLNYPDAALMQKSDYYNGYTTRAKRIKQGKVWKNWGIAFGVNVVAAIILVASGQ
ncbi:MAG: hypothetical protein J7599_14585 [Niabella sp.]|nr:hypothetical protein [Niabella sp.]